MEDVSQPMAPRSGHAVPGSGAGGDWGQPEPCACLLEPGPWECSFLLFLLLPAACGSLAIKPLSFALGLEAAAIARQVLKR